jgi:hypothetical protein
MRRSRLALIGLLALSGCVSPCASGTLFLSLTFSGAATGARELEITITVGGAAKPSVVPFAGGTQGTVEVGFPRGYPEGQAATVRVVARGAAGTLAQTTTSVTLAPGCTALSLALDGAGSDAGGDGGGDGGTCLTICPSSAACGGDIDDGCGGRLACPCQLNALHPSPTVTGAVLTLEGTFSGATTVNFPGAGAQTATVLGPHRASVVVPASATAGDLTVTSNGQLTAAVPFRRASFALGLNAPGAHYEQTDFGRQIPRLGVPRAGHSATVIREFLYVVGGAGGGGPAGPVERATINADGTLSAFTPLDALGASLGPRADHAALMIGRRLYVIGGTGNGTPLGSVMRAEIDSDGSLQNFADAGTSLSVARTRHAAVVLGRWLYVFGGEGSGGALQTVERAPIAGDGVLGAFTVVPGVTLAGTHLGGAAFAADNTLYVAGGSDGTMLSVEKSTIAVDGGLGPFSDAGITLTRRRSGAAVVRLGAEVYVLGGADGATLASIERAALSGSTLGAFAAAGPVLVNARSGHAHAVVGNYLYVIGGRDGGTFLPSIELAGIKSGGTVSAFTAVPGVGLATARVDESAAVLGSYAYVAGGDVGGAGTGTNTIERARVGADGSFANTFATVNGITLVNPRMGSSGAVVGRYWYNWGHFNADLTVERATIAPDGQISTFSTVAGVTLPVGRYTACAVVLGDYVYVIGGNSGGTFHTSIDRASIMANGDLSNFATQAGTLTTARTGHVCFVYGNKLYVAGGRNSVFEASVESATINSDGTLGPFGPSGATLPTPRAYLSAAVVGDQVYVLGGRNTTIGYHTVVERATLTATSIGGFTTVPSLTYNGRVGLRKVVTGNLLYTFGGWPQMLNVVESTTFVP